MIRIWDLGSGRQITSMSGHGGSIFSLEYSRDGTMIASGGADDSVRLWDAKKGEGIKTFMTKRTPIFSVQFTSRNILLAMGKFESGQ